MNEDRLVDALTGLVGAKLASEITTDFLKIRSDYSTKTLERSSSGKFVETFAQCLQQLANGTYATKPDVDAYLNNKVEHESTLPEGLRICAARIARSIYTMRNKRNIAHKNEVDPNTFDLAYIHQAAAWIMAELVRCASSLTMEKAGTLIDMVQAPVGTLVEEIEGTRLVHAKVPVKTEILILLHSHFPERVDVDNILKSMSARSELSVRNRLGEMRTQKLLYGDSGNGYRLTQAGHAAAVEEINRLRLT
jgi:hypothetical protein